MLDDLVAVVGAAGKTGAAISSTLLERHCQVRRLVHRPTGMPGERTVDLLDESSLRRALDGVSAAYHLAPNVHPAELEMAANIAGACAATGVPRLVFHSVLRPGIEVMPHHWAKLRAEEVLRSCEDLAVTVLQPAPYMQNFTALRGSGLLRVPYNVDRSFSLVDLSDVAEVAMRVLTESGHEFATYELAGPQELSVRDVAGQLGVTAEVEDLSEWRLRARDAQLDDYALNALSAMFGYYDQHGLPGNPRVLQWLLGREPAPFADVVRR